MRVERDDHVATAVLAWLTWLREMGVDTLHKNVVAAPPPFLESQGDVTRNSEHYRSRVSNGLVPLAVVDAPLTLPSVRDQIGECTRCKLCTGRKNIVFGEGNPKAQLMFVGEGPGADEDVQGRPFVGRAGQLLTKMISAMGFSREEVYIANIVKCRPPNNRPPEEDEIAACQPFLFQQIAVVLPKVICALGTFSAQTLLSTRARISDLRGKFHDLPDNHGEAIKVMPTFHPSYLLRSPEEKKKAFSGATICPKCAHYSATTQGNCPRCGTLLDQSAYKPTDSAPWSPGMGR